MIKTLIEIIFILLILLGGYYVYLHWDEVHLDCCEININVNHKVSVDNETQQAISSIKDTDFQIVERGLIEEWQQKILQ